MSDLSQEKSALEREHAVIVEKIHELRERARKVSIEASVTRRHIEDTEKDFWREGIAKLQTELIAVQARLGAINKELRKAKSDHPIKTLSQLPRDVVGKEEPAKSNGAGVQAPGEMKEGYALFLQFFHQLVVENLDPRMVKVFEKDAHNLVNDHRRMNRDKSNGL